MSPGKNRKTHDIDVFLNRRLNHHLRSLMKTRIDDFESRIAQRTSDHFCAAIMAIEAGFCDQNSVWSFHSR